MEDFLSCQQLNVDDIVDKVGKLLDAKKAEADEQQIKHNEIGKGMFCCFCQFCCLSANAYGLFAFL